ncbi:MAG: FAD-binding oxidoreductase [Nitrososphaerota archaeon]|nr:FAD-binding oxidoreductase [Candidatus Bathyarchaeota archaeon]MDW8049189.1 FAD-binding oxidoreductase [Nitrososphaerota archaeon]
MNGMIPDKVIERLKSIVGRDSVITDPSMLEGYLRDETPEPIRPSPATGLVLVKPSLTEEVSKILMTANSCRIPVFPVGGRTGLVGGCIPTVQGIILSLEKMNKIEVDVENLMAVAEAGATLGDLIRASETAGLFFPPHPGDEGAQIGGLIATNAGGVRAVKYGVMRSYVRGLEAVLPNGRIIRLGGKLLKNNTGYDLMQLIIGSEGTLCVITKAIIKLYPKSPYTATLILPFARWMDALKCAQEILRSKVSPLAIEYVGLREITLAAQHINEEWPANSGEAQLIVILTSPFEGELLSSMEELSRISERHGVGEIILAETKEEQERILRIRSNIYTSLKPGMVDILDVTVPPSKLSDLIGEIKRISEMEGLYMPIYGHAGDGNLHVHIMKEEGKDLEYLWKVKREIYRLAVNLGGVISGEHGIGKIRKGELGLVLSEDEIEVMREIKRLFDPNNILNPGSIFSKI